MAWIESHQTLREHPKTYALMEALGLPKPAVLGHLHLLWWWCVDYAPDGRFQADAVRQVARAADYLGEAGKFVGALVAAGFLDARGDHLEVHDWEHFQYHYRLMVERNERNREQAKERMRKKRAKNNGSQDVTRNKNERYAPVTECSPRTVPTNQPNQPTVPDQPTPAAPRARPEVVVPEDLKANEPEILDWLAFKKESGRAYKPKGLEALWRRLREIPADRRRAAVDHSMANNYQGLFEPKGGTHGQPGNGFRTRGPSGGQVPDPAAVTL